MSDAAHKQVFLIVGLKNASAIGERIRELSVRSLPLKDDSWLAIYGTTRELAEALGIRRGEIGASGLVVLVDNYSGRAPSEVWECLKVNWPQNE